MKRQKIYEGIMVLAIAGIYFFSFFQRVAVPGTIFNDLQSEFSISAAEVTRLSAVYLFIYAAMQPFVGMLADRFGGIKVLLLSGILLCIGSIAFPLSSGIMSLYCSRALVGVGASAMYLCMIKEADLSFGGKNFVPILGVLCLIGYSGGLAGTRPFRIVVEGVGWRHACMFIAMLSCLVLLITWAASCKVKRKNERRKDDGIWNRIFTVTKNPLNYPVFLTTALTFAIYFSLQATIGPKFIEDICGVSPLISSGYTFIMMLSTMAMLFFSGFISRVLGNKRRVFLLFSGLSTMIAILMFLVGIIFRMPLPFYLPAYILLALAAGTTPVLVSLTKEINSSDNVAIAIGLLNTSAYVMVAIFSQLIGVVLDRFSGSANIIGKNMVYPSEAYITLFVILLGFSVIAFIASIYSRETNGENIYMVHQRGEPELFCHSLGRKRLGRRNEDTGFQERG